MNSRYRIAAASAVAWIAVLGGPGSAQALVNLVWRPALSEVCIGDTVNVGLYAASDNEEVNEPILGADVFFTWDSRHLTFLGITNTGQAPNIQMSTLPTPDPCGANEASPAADGTGLYVMAARLGRTVIAPPEGALLTTFRFRATTLAPAAAIGVMVRWVGCLQTKVYDEAVANLNIINPQTGYGSVAIRAGCGPLTEACCLPDETCRDLTPTDCESHAGVSQGATSFCETTNCASGCECAGDLTGDARRDGLDIAGFVGCVTVGGAECGCADVDGNSLVDSSDVSALVTILLGNSACP